MAERNDAAYRRYIDQLSDLARSALPLYGVDTRADIGLLSHSENTVFRIEDRRAGFKPRCGFTVRITRRATPSRPSWTGCAR